ncbi:MAG: hypothetical protein ACK5MP_08855 [Nostocoides sp.]
MSDQGNTPQSGDSSNEPTGPPPPPPAGPAVPNPYEATGSAGTGYEAMPGMTPANAGPVPARPKAMDTAVQLMRAGGVLALLGTVFIFLVRDEIRTAAEKAMRDSGETYNQATVDAVVTMAMAMGVAMGVLGAALWFWMASANGKGRAWARIVATVLFAISVLSVLGSLVSAPSLLSALPSLISVLIGAAAIFFMYKRESSSWYTEMSRPRY